MSKNKADSGNMIESTTLEPVPQNARKKWTSVAFITAGGMICVPSLVIGGTLVAEMSLPSAILAGSIGYALTVILSYIMGIMGGGPGGADLRHFTARIRKKGRPISCQCSFHRCPARLVWAAD